MAISSHRLTPRVIRHNSRRQCELSDRWPADKIEMFRIPAIGWNMRLNRYIALRRGQRDSIAQMMSACEQTLAEGNSVMMFPEGTRSPDGHLKDFKHGAFTLALRGQVPILPIVVEGTARALPKHGFVLRGPHAIRIRILDAIPYASFAGAPVEALTQRNRELFVAELGEPPRRNPPESAARTG